MIRNRELLLAAGLVWLLAGLNIARIGFKAYAENNLSAFNFFCSVCVFAVFWFMVFNKLVTKHTTRIKGNASAKQYFWKFFDLKSFLIMAFMMTMGITIRGLNLLPEVFIAVFYTGLGVALALAGIKFSVNYVRYGE